MPCECSPLIGALGPIRVPIGNPPCVSLRGFLVASSVDSCQAFGWGSYALWQSGRVALAAVAFWCYCTLYTSSGDSRWHECGHGTAFKTKWKNDVL